MCQITLSLLRRELTQQLSPTLADEAPAAARALMQDALNLSLTDLLTHGDAPRPPQKADSLRQMAQRLAAGEPLQYVTAQATFCNLTLHIAPGALIPRPETEQLVDWATATIPSNAKILDIGTGSGCIAISLASQLPNSQVFALDLSPDALRIAQQNANSQKVKITFLKADILTATLPSLNGPYDVVISNPPYVMEREKASMSPSVLNYEPHSALFVPDADPLVFYRRIGELCVSGLLTNGGHLFFEINEALGNETVDLLRSLGFENIELRKDFDERDRMIHAVR